MGTRIKSVRGGVGKASYLHAGGTTGFPTDIRGLKTAELTLARGRRIGCDLRWGKLSFPRRFYLVWIVLADGLAASLFYFTTVAMCSRMSSLYLKASFAEACDQMFYHIRLPPYR
jgi:hypothetical protein